jgi:xanthine/uracil permease
MKCLKWFLKTLEKVVIGVVIVVIGAFLISQFASESPPAKAIEKTIAVAHDTYTVIYQRWRQYQRNMRKANQASSQ